MPIKCPVAPLEFCFLADWYFHERGIRDQVQLTYVTPLDGAFTKPVASARLAGMLAEKGIDLVTEFNTGEVDGVGATSPATTAAWWISTWRWSFRSMVELPYVGRSPGLGDELNFVPTDEHTLQSEAAPNVFVIGDAANVPASKAGSVTHFEGEVLVENIRCFLAGEPLDRSFDGHTNCFIETGFHKALLIDFNYDTEPLPGHYPSGVGLPLLAESRLNHLGKLMFQWFYWHGLLPGRDVPGISSAMPSSGKIPAQAERIEKGLSHVDSDHCRNRSGAQRRGLLRPTRTVDRRLWSPSSPRREGIDELTDAHWQVIRFMRSEFLAKGTGPTVRVLGKTSGVSIKELYQLFPKGPAKVAAKIAGIPKPRGCI